MRVEMRGKRFGALEVLGGFELEIAPGETVALTGPSGVGKSTLLRIIAGLDQAFDGAVSGVGRIAMVFQSPTLMLWRRAEANLRIPTGVNAATAQRLLTEVGLEGRGDAFPGQLSLGQQRRLALARALAADPELLLMDEPFVSLDEETATRMRALTLSVLSRRKIATVIATHEFITAAELAHRVVALGGAPATIQGEVRIQASPERRDAQSEAQRLRAMLR